MAQLRFAEWLLASLSCGVVAVDDSARMAALNGEAQRILAVPAGSPEELLGLDCRKVLRSQPAVPVLLLDALTGRERPGRAELVLDTSEGQPQRTVGFTSRVVRDPSGRIRGAALLFRDLTPFERTDEQEQLRARLAALGQMAAGMAHEIRNPLAGIEVIAGLLQRRLADRSEECFLLEELIGELRAVDRVVSSSLDFVRPSSLCRELHAPVELVVQSIERARKRVTFPGVVEYVCREALPAISVDADSLQAVLTDLMVNAFEAMMGTGAAAEEQELRIELQTRRAAVAARTLRIEASDATGGVTDGFLEVEAPRWLGTAVAARSAEPGSARELVISIADSGPGVPAELRERIFYPFFTTKESGSGVGLATAQKIVIGHGGSLELESPPGGGALFRVCLPLDPAS